ncbi:hypothetical protein GA0070563_1128 [Micromonospora carbonacea]|uniref:Uncharacterized protein n=1 Tax=Micromonospora carbonacea TaxID=47853 RepID=A0A1C5A9H0_9ACTN|nr:hypothetical protein GA0070563_1128 [Micromonospora carbonacea]
MPDLPDPVIGLLIVFGVLAGLSLIHIAGTRPRRRR